MNRKMMQKANKFVILSEQSESKDLRTIDTFIGNIDAQILRLSCHCGPVRAQAR